MASYHQFGIRALGDTVPPTGGPKSEVVQMLVMAAFLLSICIIAIVIGAASAQY